jgi:uncharacterized protein YeaO (DUF488 family)
MPIHIVRLGTKRLPSEGLRIGTVRHPPRGVSKALYASGDWYDVWLPELAPSAALVKVALGAGSERDWQAFVRRYRAEMKRPEANRLLDLLAALSRGSAFSVGCYCADESRCHRSILRALFLERGAEVSDQAH